MEQANVPSHAPGAEVGGITANQKKKKVVNGDHLWKHWEKVSFNRSRAHQNRCRKTKQMEADFGLPLLWEDHISFQIHTSIPTNHSTTEIPAATGLKSHCHVSAVSQPKQAAVGEEKLASGWIQIRAPSSSNLSKLTEGQKC